RRSCFSGDAARCWRAGSPLPVSPGSNCLPFIVLSVKMGLFGVRELRIGRQGADGVCFNHAADTSELRSDSQLWMVPACQYRRPLRRKVGWGNRTTSLLSHLHNVIVEMPPSLAHTC